MKNPETISVIIPTKNEEKGLLECLSSVFSQSLKPIEVIIVDGQSTDNTLKIASQFPVRVITETAPTSLPNARNLGAKAAIGDIVFIMDADVILDKNCFQEAIKYFEDSNTIAVIPTEQNIPHSKLEKIQIDWNKGGSNPYRPGLGIDLFAEFLRKSIFSNVMFNPSLGYGEDEDFQYRLRCFYSASGKIIHSPDSIVSVHFSHTIKELKSQYTWYGRTFKTFFKKNNTAKPFLNFASLTIPTILIILIFPSVFFTLALAFLLLFSVFIVARNIIVCYRSKSLSFFEFVGFEFLRSFFFVRGLFQGLFSKEKGRID